MTMIETVETTISSERACIQNLPCNRGYLIGNNKVYGYKDPIENGDNVILEDVNTGDKVKYFRRGKSISGKNGVCKYIGIKSPCSEEIKSGFCELHKEESEIGNSHRNNFYHFCFIVPTFCGDKPVCRYSILDKGNLCWERNDREHMENFHHDD